MKTERTPKSSNVTGFKLSIGHGFFKMELTEIDDQTLLKLMSSTRKTLIIAILVASLAGVILSPWGRDKVADLCAEGMSQSKIFLRAP